MSCPYVRLRYLGYIRSRPKPLFIAKFQLEGYSCVADDRGMYLLDRPCAVPVRESDNWRHLRLCNGEQR